MNNDKEKSDGDLGLDCGRLPVTHWVNTFWFVVCAGLNLENWFIDTLLTEISLRWYQIDNFISLSINSVVSRTYIFFFSSPIQRNWNRMNFTFHSQSIKPFLHFAIVLSSVSYHFFVHLPNEYNQLSIDFILFLRFACKIWSRVKLKLATRRSNRRTFIIICIHIGVEKPIWNRII